jgi:hypothetical protein
MFLHEFKKHNKQHIGIITLLNTTSRELNARAIKTTQATEIKNKLIEMIYETGRQRFSIIRTDGGPEFKNNLLQETMDKELIEIEYTEAHSHNALARTNRLHRTIKGMIRDVFLKNGNKQWVEHLKSIVDLYNKTPQHGIDREGETAPKNIDEDQLKKIHEQEVEIAQKVYEIDSKKLKVGDYIRLFLPATKEQIKLNGKFLKKSLSETWTTKIYQIIERTGPNFWRIDADNSEIQQWPTYHLKKSTKSAYDNQEKKNKQHDKEIKAVKVARAEKEEQKSISKQEMKDNLKSVGQQHSALQMQTRLKKTRKRINVKAAEQEEFEIEKLVDKDKINGLVHYKVRWLGYTAKDDTWESHSKLVKTHSNLIREWNRQ